MNIVFVSLCCAPSRFRELLQELKNPEQSDQKLFTLLIEGMSANDNTISTVSALPVNRHNCHHVFIPTDKRLENKCNYNHMAVLNIPLLYNLSHFIQSAYLVFQLSKNKKKLKDTIVICDILKLSIASGAIVASKILGVKCVGIVTDVPRKRPRQFNILFRMIDTIRFHQLQSYNAYIFLTEQMNELINKNKRPYIVLEGTVDSNMAREDNKLANKIHPRICMYSGTIHRVYGIETLVKGFIIADLQNTELWIYGDGDYRNELELICLHNKNIKFFGVVPNQEVVKTQMNATLLINPRPAEGEYTKYSFPSKNLEYLASGTPVLAAMLPGMPEEYRSYIYELHGNSPDSMAHCLQEVLKHSDAELYEKGRQAKEFVLRYKNNIIQGSRIIRLFEEVT